MQANSTNQVGGLRITVIGAGTIGLSLVALHLRNAPSAGTITIVDVRPDLKDYVRDLLPTYLPTELHTRIEDIRLTASLEEGVRGSAVVQESGPENLDFKTQLWQEVEKFAPPDAFLWTSTSGIPASKQVSKMQDKSRLLVVHPFNPPHILPLLEIVPSPYTSQPIIDQTMKFWQDMGREPVLLSREITGFVAGRLAWALLREAIHLVDQDIVTVQQLDRIIETSMGPRWAYAGPFKSFHAGGGSGGLEGLFDNIGATIQACWDDGGRERVGERWEGKIFRQTRHFYSRLDLQERDVANQMVLEAIEQAKNQPQ